MGRVLNGSDTLLDKGFSPEHRRSAGSSDLTYRECQSPAGLTGVVECFWRREPWRPVNHGLGVLPDGRIDLIWAEGDLLVIGPQTRPVRRPLPPDVVVIGVRFPPAVGPALLGLSAHELRNTHVPLEAIDARPAASLRCDLAAIEDSAAAAPSIARAIAKRLDSRRSPDLAVRHAAALLEDPNARVRHVAGALGLSERQLQRRFRAAVGYGPKTLQRVLRFQRLLSALKDERDQPAGLASTAAATGYSDQAHLSREASEFSGQSPALLKLALDALSDAGASGIFKTGRPATAGPGTPAPRQ